MAAKLAERVNRYIASGLHTGVCDTCIAKVIGIWPTQVTLVCTALATTKEFTRDRGYCDKCGKRRQVTRRAYG